MKPHILTLIEEKVGNSLKCIGTGKDFLNGSSMAQALRSTINVWDLMKLKSFCKAKDTVSKTNKLNLSATYRFEKRPSLILYLIQSLYQKQNLKKLDSRKPKIPIEKWITELNIKFSTEECKMS
jgi:cytochrome c2